MDATIKPTIKDARSDNHPKGTLESSEGEVRKESTKPFNDDTNKEEAIEDEGMKDTESHASDSNIPLKTQMDRTLMMIR